jgi:hypothetical protein
MALEILRQSSDVLNSNSEDWGVACQMPTIQMFTAMNDEDEEVASAPTALFGLQPQA